LGAVEVEVVAEVEVEIVASVGVVVGIGVFGGTLDKPQPVIANRTKGDINRSFFIFIL